MTDTTTPPKLFRRPECASPCATCPWRRENHGKPHADGWYDPKNLRRLWNGIRQGEQMICHATDPESIDYGGDREVSPGHERICVGALALVQAHVEVIEKIAKGLPEGQRTLWRDYRKVASVPNLRMTMRGVHAHAERIIFGGVFGGVPVPRTLTDCGTISVPWSDPILNAPEASDEVQRDSGT